FNNNFNNSSFDFNPKSNPSLNSTFKSNFHNYNSNLNFQDFKTTIGDDSALIEHGLDDNGYLVASSDMLIQSTHFPDAMTYYQMGYKSVVVNVSDLAAMGSRPIGLLISLAIPKNLLLDDFDELICGIISACNDYQIPLIGGDTNEAKEIIISATVLGKSRKGTELMKYGFNEGDLIAITGELGLAALGFELLADNDKLKKAREIDPTFVDLAIFKALKPKACQLESFILSKYQNKKNYRSSKSSHQASKINISATDITDGLASELYELLERDKQYNLSINPNLNYTKGIRIYGDSLPIEDEFKEITEAIGLNYLDLFFHIGEDFELLFTIPKDFADILKEELDLFIIGEVINSENSSSKDYQNKNNFTVEMVLSNSKPYIISPKGYQHLVE
ncbi:MAG: thiamine-phosphate kinase, partial [Methanobacteriaceae archaeon]|nr:thiamine-phosphate kinase [Methanobacteriaceae archaeon]